MKKLFQLLILAILILTVASCGKKKAVIKTSYAVSAVTNKDYRIESANLAKAKNPILTLKRGLTYEFKIDAFGHPFFIKDQKIEGKSAAYAYGVTNNGTDEGVILFTVPLDSPDTLYYVCQYHKMMGGKIKIID